ncbi:hypothetical protein [Lutibacter flavus]|uniref:Curlin associated repeat-containing protein n=1 Tax=Lutibacter flavus TaxID=691689 RepID=A0A238ZMC2_9FLAO|nr:hypothetical protein [Lutibacter flavus]SNR84322.1 Curlin associated repeat-containing protein [Lutibacter flavus]
MKKLLLSVALLFATSMLFAQVQVQERQQEQRRGPCFDCGIVQIQVPVIFRMGNVSDIDQMGVHNVGDVDQTGNMNYSKVLQEGNWNYARVNQSGYGNTVKVEQDGDRNWDVINQSGSWNFAYQDIGVGWAEDNVATINQYGQNHKAFQKVRYDGNNATINQYNGFMGYGGNYAEQDQSSFNHGFGSDAIITQTGRQNAAKQVQRGSLNEATATQWGRWNTSVEEQSNPQFSWAKNISTVYQMGDFNLSCVDQNTNGTASNFSTVDQIGSFNYATVHQTGGMMYPMPF